MVVSGPARAQSVPGDFDTSYPISIGTGSPSGVYFAVGNAICRLAVRQSNRPVVVGEAARIPLRCAAPATPGSIYNLAELRSGGLTFGIVQSDWQYHAYRGTSRFAGQPFRKLRAVLALHPEVLQIVLGRETAAAGLGDLAGKRVSIGPVGSGTRATLEALLKADDVPLESYSHVADLALGDQSQELCAGNIEMAAYLIGVPSSMVEQSIKNCGGRLMELHSAGVQALLDQNRYLAPAVVRAGTYSGLDRDVPSLAVVATLLTTESASEAVVYEVTRDVFERLEDLRAMHPALAQLQPSRMLYDGISIPLHPGAARYFTERGWIAAGGH